MTFSRGPSEPWPGRSRSRSDSWASSGVWPRTSPSLFGTSSRAAVGSWRRTSTSRTSRVVVDDLQKTLDFTLDFVSAEKGLVSNIRQRDLAIGREGVDFGTSVRRQIAGSMNLADLVRAESDVIFEFDNELLERIPFAIEGGDDALVKFMEESLSPNQRTALESVLRAGDEIGELAREEDVIKDLIDNYVTHVVKFDDPKGRRNLSLISEFARAADKRRRTQPARRGRRRPLGKYGLTRAFDTLQDLVKFSGDNPQFGMTVELNFNKIFEQYVRSTLRAITRNQMLGTLSRLTDVDGLQWIAVKGTLRGKELVAKNPDLYVAMPDPVFEKFLFHKDVADHVRSLFSSKFSYQADASFDRFDQVLEGIERANALGKSTTLNLSPFFHIVSLGYSAFAGLPPRIAGQAIREVGRNIGPAVREVGEAVGETLTGTISASVANRQREVTENILTMWSNVTRRSSGEIGPVQGISSMDMVREYLTSGAQVGRIESDFSYDALENFLVQISNTFDEGSFLRNAFTGARHINQAFDRAMWNVIKDGLSMFTWVHARNQIFLDMVKKGGRPAKRIFQDPTTMGRINAEAQNIVKGMFGGVLDQLILNPRFRRFSRFALLGPDWTLANLRMGTDMVLNMPGLREQSLGFVTRDVLMADQRFRWALGYNMRAAFYYTVMGNMMNWAFTAMKGKEPQFLFSDAVMEDKEQFRGVEIDVIPRIELPWNRGDGRRQFANIAKQFLEPYRFAFAPGEILQAKLGPLPRAITALVVGVDGFGRPIYGDERGTYRDLIQRGVTVGGQLLPIPIQGVVDAARGFRDLRSVAIQSMFGIGVRSEDREFFERRQRIEGLKAQISSGDFRSDRAREAQAAQLGLIPPGTAEERQRVRDLSIADRIQRLIGVGR